MQRLVRPLRHAEEMLSLLTALALGVNQLAVGQVVPPLNIHDAAGQASAFKPAARGLTLLNFWATWCPPCREELPRLLAAQHPGKLKVVAVNVGQSPDGVLKFWHQQKLEKLPLAFARSGDLNAWPLPGLPTSVLLDASGRVRAVRFGPVSEAELAGWGK
ncbi:TlpA family protein disulfide reductase [Deinococcus sp.]|uniref:TlpA family protein disulfide reductase n=1 Tax=Deinococcus sp. TaxID=47478 RepID=UPI003B59379C